MVTASGNGEFDHLNNWMRSKLHIILDTCAADSHVLKAKIAIKFVKEKLRFIQCETLFKKIQKD